MGPPENPYQPPTAEVPFAASADADGVLLLATRGQRFTAQLVDVLALLAIMLPLQWSMGVFNQSAYERNGWMQTLLWGFGMLGIMLALQGYLWATRAQSIGKAVVGTKIVTLDGENADFARIVLRRVLPMSLLALIPGIGGLIGLADSLAIFRKDHRCLHDHVAGTKVVQILFAPVPARFDG